MCSLVTSLVLSLVATLNVEAGRSPGLFPVSSNVDTYVNPNNFAGAFSRFLLVLLFFSSKAAGLLLFLLRFSVWGHGLQTNCLGSPENINDVAAVILLLVLYECPGLSDLIRAACPTFSVVSLAHYSPTVMRMTSHALEQAAPFCMRFAWLAALIKDKRTAPMVEVAKFAAVRTFCLFSVGCFRSRQMSPICARRFTPTPINVLPTPSPIGDGLHYASSKRCTRGRRLARQGPRISSAFLFLSTLDK